MALQDILPDLRLLQQTLSGLDERLAAAAEPFDLDHHGDLRHLADEADDQIRTAERPFTIAVVGEFKVGKSTLLNALLGLSGEAALSAQDTPDTACSILLRQRGEKDPEARLEFQDGTVSDVTWAEAKRLTSQVHRDRFPQDRERGRQLLEVVRYLQAPLLAQVQLNDLPGTGSRYSDEHTKLTRRRMKEADAVLWVVADQVPSAEARRDLSILAEYSHTVVPIVNVIEDPEADPPLRRNDERVQEICEVLMREFRTYFSPEIERPLLVSARVVEIERARPRPSPETLREAGLDTLMELLERMFLVHQEGQTQGRRSRVCGAATAIIDKAQAYLAGVLESIGRKEELAEIRLSDAERRVGEIEILNDDLRGSIRTMAQATAATVCDKVSRMAATFVEDQLQLVQFNNLRRSLTARSRELLAADLQRRFLGPQYLKLDRPPHWLDDLNADYAEQVRAVVVAQWSRLGRVGGAQKLTLPGSSLTPMADLDRLGRDLQQAIVAVLGKLLGVAGFTGALALIPGGQALVALGFAGAAGLAAANNPLAERRRRAIDLVQSQILSHRHTLARELFDAGLAGSHLLSAQVRASLQSSLDEASQRRLDLVELRSRLREGEVGLGLLRQGLTALQNGREGD